MIRRARPPGVIGVEVWDLHVPLDDGRVRPLYEFRSPAERAFALPRAVAALREGRATAWSGRAFSPRCQEIGGVVLAGGNATAEIAAALALDGDSDAQGPRSPAPLPCRVLPGGPFAGVLGAPTVARDAHLSGARVAACDIGQSGIKLAAFSPTQPGEPPRTSLHPRDWSLLPVVDDLPAARVPAARAAFIDWAGATLASLSPGPDALVLALPCEIDDDTALGGCTYPWERGESRIVGELLARARLDDIPVLLLNDAELAAASAAASLPPSPRYPALLVLTIGLGIGGALLLR